MIKFAFVFRPLSAISREGMDALLAATAFCNENELAVFFIDDGVLNLLSDQKPELILRKILVICLSYWICVILNNAIFVNSLCNNLS